MARFLAKSFMRAVLKGDSTGLHVPWPGWKKSPSPSSFQLKVWGTVLVQEKKKDVFMEVAEPTLFAVWVGGPYTDLLKAF